MVNFGFNAASLIGVISCLFAIFYFVLTIALLIVTLRQSGSVINIATRIIQLLIAPFCLFLSGFILTFQGWRYDPLMQFGTLLNELLLFYYMIKDIKSMNRNP